MLDFAWEGGMPTGGARDPFGCQLTLLAVVVLFTAISLYPLTGYAVGPFPRVRLRSQGGMWAAAACLLALLLACLEPARYLLGPLGPPAMGRAGRRRGSRPGHARARVRGQRGRRGARGARPRDATSFASGTGSSTGDPHADRVRRGVGDRRRVLRLIRFWSDADRRRVDSAHLLE